MLLVRLLTGTLVHELAERTPARVSLQQGHLTSVDDIVLHAPAPDGVSAVRLEIAVRRRPKFIQSDTPTGKLVLALVRADLAAERESNPSLERRLAVAVSGQQSHARELAELAHLARAQSSAKDFFALVRTPKKFATRGRLEQLLGMVGAALECLPESDAGTPELRCFSLLRRLWVMPLALEPGNESGWTAVAEELRAVAIGQSTEAAIALRDRIEQLAGTLTQNAASLDAAGLRQRLHGEIAPEIPVPSPGWHRLRSLDEEARAIVARAVTGAHAVTLTLPRQTIRDALERALSSDDDLLVHGDSGVGKSALVMDAVDPERLGPNRQALAINLRHLPRTPLELEALLIDPPAALLRGLTAPERWLVIDAAEAVLEGHGEVLSYLLRQAREAGVRVIGVVTNEAAEAVRGRWSYGANGPRALEIPGLEDEELAEVARRFPALQRLLDNPRGRELLRRPIVIDLLSRAGEPGLLLNESQALEHIWQHLVRGGEHSGRSAPDAREHATVLLGAHALEGGDVETLLTVLDHEAVDALRRANVLLPASPLPWERVPAFKHDLIRTYAVARFLLRERDPAAALLACNAPRWTLPAARLACEIILSAPGTSSHPRSGRFTALQRGFDALAGHSDVRRWADVPAEAMLAASVPAELLEDAWPELVEGEAHGLARLIRVLNGRHQRRGVLDPFVAEPVIARVLASNTPIGRSAPLGELILDWLRARVVTSTPAGNAQRVRLRERILRRCADEERHLDAQEASRRRALAERTPEEIAADEERRRTLARHALFSSPPSARTRPNPDRHRPCLWIRELDIECLALLGPDLDAKGEAILRRIAEDEPHSLVHAVEAPLAGAALASHAPALLIDLCTAYYIEDEEEDGFGTASAALDDGIRPHRYHGLCAPSASYLYGPFLPLLRADYVGGIALINGMLDHAAENRTRVLSRLRAATPADEASGEKKSAMLAIGGEPREFIGDAHVWSWYRGTSVGPEPCTSALQALEFVTEEAINAGLSPRRLATHMVSGARSLAMPALALAVLIRHLEAVGDAIDSYLVEPLVWELELSRVANEYAGAPTSAVPELPNLERRRWSLREVSAVLAFRAEGERVGQLKAVGEALEARADALVIDQPPAGRQLRIATIRQWAAWLDREAYEVTQNGGQLQVRQALDPEVEQALLPSRQELDRVGEALGLVARHDPRRGVGNRRLSPEPDVLAADLATARNLAENPPRGDSFAIEGSVAVAAAAIEHHLGAGLPVADQDLIWSAVTLLEVASSLPGDGDDLNLSAFHQGAAQLAARALPYLLLPAAHGLRMKISSCDADDAISSLAPHRALAVDAGGGTRLAYARALDIVWAAPCDMVHLSGRCHHRVAFELVTASFVESVLGEWDPETHRRPLLALAPPEAASLDDVEVGKLYEPRLLAALRAFGAAAISSACCAKDAKVALSAVLSAHQRALCAREHSYHHRHSHSLVAARAALWQAIVGVDETVLQYVRAYLSDARLLAEALQAVNAAAEERPDAARHARRLWPRIMDIVLDAAEADPTLFTERTWGSNAESSLIPNPSSSSYYLTIERADEPYPWRDLLAWAPQVERWLGTIPRTRNAIDHLVIAVSELGVTVQVDQGLRWIERIVSQGGESCANTFTLPEWLRDRQTDLVGEEQIDRWRRVVDALVVSGDDRVADLAD